MASKPARQLLGLLLGGLLALQPWQGVEGREWRPQRIVSLAPHITELLFEAGLGERVVGISEGSDSLPAARGLPRVANHQGANLEAIAALKPDLVLVWPGGNRAADIAALERLGLRVEPSAPMSLREIGADLQRFAAWAGPPAQRKVQALIEQAERDLAHWQQQAEALPRPRLRVFYQLGPERLYTLTARHPVNDALQRCGADNVFADLPGSAPEVAREAVLAAQPDAILLASRKSLEASIRAWQSTGAAPEALRKGRIRAVDGERLHRPSLATFAAVQELCATIRELRLSLPSAPK